MTNLQVRVKPNARTSELLQKDDGTWLANIKSPPVVGKGNAELVGLVARHFALPKACVSIKSGASGRIKVIRIDTAWLRQPA